MEGAAGGEGEKKSKAEVVVKNGGFGWSWFPAVVASRK